MVGEELPTKAEIRNLLVELLFLPSKGFPQEKFDQVENEITEKIDGLVNDPYWSDYLFFSHKFGLVDPMAEKDDGEFVIDDAALDAIVDKILSHKPIVL